MLMPIPSDFCQTRLRFLVPLVPAPLSPDPFHFWISLATSPDLDPQPARSPASKRRDRRRLQRRRNGAAVTEAAPDTPEERGPSASGTVNTTTAASKRRNRRRRRRQNPAADKPKREAPVTDNTENTQTGAQGSLHNTAISKSENNKEGIISTRGDSPQKTGCCYLEAHSGDSLVQITSNQIVDSNETSKRNFQFGNKEVQVSTAGSSFHARGDSATEIKDARSKLLKKSDVRCVPNNCSTQENTNMNMDYQREYPVCAQVKNTDLAGNSEEFKQIENGSFLNSSSLKDEKRRRKKKRKGKKNNHSNTGTTQDPPLSTGADTSGLMTMVAENNTAGLKCMGLREKQNQNDVTMTNSFSLDSVKTTEGGSVSVHSTIEKEYGVFQPGSCEEKEAENVTELLGSCMLESNKLASTNVSPMLLQGVRVDANVKMNCLHPTTEGEVYKSAFGEDFTKLSGVVSTPYSSENNQNLGCAKHMREAILRPSFISSVIENVLLSENQKNQLDPFNEGANFFQIGYPASNDGAVIHHGVNIHDLGAMGNSEYQLGRSYLNCTSAERNKLQEKEVNCLPTDHNINCISHSSLAQAYTGKLKIAFSQRQSLMGFRKKKLLILDLNGLLADINEDYHNSHMADAKVRRKLVFRRPYCDDFLNFCIQNFELGIWSSRKRENVDSVVDILMRDLKPYLLFSWDRSKCTFTGRKTLKNMHKPLVLKELRKLWNKEEPGLSWEEGDFSPSNTLLVDDSPYKALRNPPHTAIFPYPYSYLNSNDNSLGPGGDLRVYLENLAVADDVECYIRNHPFGQPFITQSDPDWNFYAQIIDEGYGSLTCRS